MGRKSKVERYILLDTEEKCLEVQKYEIAKQWLIFLRGCEDKLKNLKFEEVFDKSFHDEEKGFYFQRIRLVLGNLDMYKLDYDDIVRELNSSIKHSAEVLEIPSYVRFGKLKIIREVDENTGFAKVYKKLEYKLR